MLAPGCHWWRLEAPVKAQRCLQHRIFFCSLLDQNIPDALTRVTKTLHTSLSAAGAWRVTGPLPSWTRIWEASFLLHL